MNKISTLLRSELKSRLKGRLLRGAAVAALALLFFAGGPAWAADYVFIYDGGYLAVDNNGAVIYTTTFSPQCVWTCVSNSGTLDASNLATNGQRFLYTTVNGTKYWLNSSAGNGNAITVTTEVPGTAYWRTDNSARLIYRNNATYYAYYRGNSWRVTSRNGYDNNNNSYTGGAWSYTDYRVSYTTVTTTQTAATSTNPTINGADVLTATGNSTYTATGAAYRNSYTNYRFNDANHYVDADGNSFGAPANATLTNAWSLTDNAYATVNSTSGVVTVTSLPEYDIVLTLTVTATATGGTPAAPAGTTLTDTKEITIQGTKPSAPTITVNGNNVTLATTAAGSTTIRYTLDGSDPTTSTGTVYSGTIDLSTNGTSPVTIKAVTVRNGNASNVSSEVVMLTLPEPTLTINGETGTASISSSVAGATIYYTTDGSTPTTSSSQYTGTITGLAFMTTVKAIAVKDGWNNSPVASGTVTIPSGVSSSTVTLDDREDHRWTYYSGVDASVDGGNYNTNYVGKLYSPNPRNVKITYNGVNGITGSSTTVKVSVDAGETQNQFVYYKTLEEGTTSGEYPYQVISNPFSVRPSTGTGNSKVYYGFAGWKIVSGGEYIKNHSNNDVLALDEEIVFNNLPYPSVNCTSAEIVFQTTWTQANVQDGTNIATMLSNFSGGTYETNFAVLRATYTTAWTGNKNATITSVMPDGSSDYRGVVTRLNVTLNAGNTIKYEYININNDGTTLSMGSGTKTLYIGRGVSNSDPTRVVCGTIQGYNDAIGNNGGLTYTLKIESGIYNNLSFIKGYEGNRVDERVQGNVAVKSVLGCDYDRANGNNNNFKIQSNIAMGYANNNALLRSTTAGQEVLNVTFKSGSLNSNMTNAGTADLSQSFYIGIGGQYSPGYRVFTMEGGEMWNLAAGLCNNTATTNSIRFRIKGGLIKGSIYGSAANANSYGYKQMILTGGQVKGWIAGGGNGTSANGGTTTGSSYLYVGGNCRVDSEGSDTKINSSVGGQVFGSGSGVDGSTTWGEMLYGSNVVIADNAYVERNVFGGGNFGWTDEYATIYLTGDMMSVGKVFGGANQNKGDNVRIYMTGGTVREGLYGGSNTTGTINYNVEMHINGGQVGTSSSPANIHGGGYGQPTRVSQNVDITLGATGQTTPGVTVYGDVYGGSALGYVNGTSTNNNNYHTYVTLNKGTINGSLYGGGLGQGTTAANVYGTVQVKVYGGSVRKTDSNGANGSGGVYGCNNVYGSPQQSVTVDIYGTDPAPSANEYALYAVYGGGNAADYTYGNGYPKVTVHNCDNSIEYVYGGGNAARVAATDVTIYGGNVIGNVFGGGNGTVTAANVTGNTLTNIYGGTILRVFGGSNSQGTIGGTITVNAESQTESGTNPITGTAFARCPIHVGELYGGGNMANSNVGSINIGCMNDGDIIDYVYGGANQANVSGDIALTMTGGRVENLFGGNNTSGTVSGGINVTVNWATGNDACSDNYLGNVFGGGNLAKYTIPSGKTLQVNILNGTVTHNVYGGGNGNLVASTNTDPDNGRGAAGKVTGNPAVTIGDDNGNHIAKVLGDVYGGGNAADVAGTPVIVVNDCNTEIGYLYGGGNAADVNGTNITVNGGTIHHDAFGGGHGDNTVTVEPLKYADVKGNVVFNVYGGTFDRVFAGSNSKGSITGTSALTVNKTGSCAMKIREVYGGGNEAAGKAGSVTIGCTGTLTANHSTNPENIGTTLEGIGSVFGGANQADIGASGNGNASNITVNINSGIVGNVFGGNNTSGTIHGTITVNIEKDNNATCASNWYVGNVYGGGNLAQYTGAPAVNIKNGTVSLNVYGGGKGDPNDHTKGQITGNPVVTIGDATPANSSYQATVSGSVFGGGDAGNVSGTPVVNVVEKCNTVITTAVYGGGNAADVTGTSVTINGGTIGDVFGGGNGAVAAANVTGSTSLTIHGGTIAHVFAGGNKSGTINNNTGVTIDHTSSCDQAIDEVYGGGNEAAGNAGTVSISCSAEHIGDVYGGANKANVTNDITLNITGGQIDNVFGGNNTSGSISGGITVNINKAANCNTFSVNNVYGGGNLAQYTIPNNKALAVNILNGTVSQNVYGGGKGDPNDHSKGQVTGNPVVTIGDANNLNSNTIVAAVTGDVYGGGDAGNVVGTPVVNVINKCNTTIGNVYGGGNAADVNGTDVNIDGGIITGMVFGGGHGDKDATPPKQADVNGNVAVDITGGTIAKVFGGSNSKGTISGTVAVNIEKDANSCEMHITEVYGGGNQAAGNAGTLTIGCTGGATEGIGDVYGGAREANINSDITLNITGGKINNVFGGNNISGSINGGITVNVIWDGSCLNSLQNVYGGGNLAQYAIPDGKALAVNILNGTVSQNVYGGGKGLASDHTKGQVTGNPQVTIGDITAGHESYVATVGGDVYGGGDAGNVVGTPVVTIPNKANTSVVNVYGGGNAADVSGTDVTISGGQISGMVFGGGHGDKDVTPQKEANVNGNVAVKVYGGTISKVFGGSNSKGNITGAVTVTVSKSTATGAADMKIGEVYGGGNYAAGNAGTLNIGCTGTWTTSGEHNHTNANSTDNRIGYELEGVGTVFGGANQANIGTAQSPSNITVNINSGIVNTVFGGNNNDGDIYGTITVNIAKNANTCSWYVGNVYGGGFNADYTNAALNNPAVNVSAGKVTYNVYGGGKGAGAVVTGNPTVTLSGTAEVGGNVYGGGDAAAVDGNTNVILRD